MIPPKESLAALEDILRCLQLWESSFVDSGLSEVCVGGQDMHFFDIINEVNQIPDEDIKLAVVEVYVKDMSPGDIVDSGMKEQAEEGLEFLLHRLGSSWS